MLSHIQTSTTLVIDKIFARFKAICANIQIIDINTLYIDYTEYRFRKHHKNRMSNFDRDIWSTGTQKARYILKMTFMRSVMVINLIPDSYPTQDQRYQDLFLHYASWGLWLEDHIYHDFSEIAVPSHLQNLIPEEVYWLEYQSANKWNLNIIYLRYFQ